MAAESNHKHIFTVEDTQGTHEHVLDSPVYSVGRDQKCDIKLSSQYVSRRHATLVQLTDDDDIPYYRIVDGNLKGKPSSNGLVINGRKTQAHDLKHGDFIVFGPEVNASYRLSSEDSDLSPEAAAEAMEATLINPDE